MSQNQARSRTTSVVLFGALALALAPAGARAALPSGAQLSRFALGETSTSLTLARESSPQAASGRLTLFAGDELRVKPLYVLEPPLASSLEPRYPKTRVGVFGLSGETRIGVEGGLSLDKQRACGSGSGRMASGSGEFRIFDPNGVPLTTSAYGWTRLFQGREYIPMIDAYDFRARTLWPELGRFGQEDPAGTVDSTNRYQALGGRWTSVTDPTGKYELDVHFYAIYFLTRAAGFGVPAARRIAWASQYVDNSPEGKPAPESATDARGARNALAEQERIGALHFAGPFGQVVVENNVYGRGGVRLAARRKDLTRLGVALHTFADSFSHAGFIMKWDKRNERTDSYRPDVGHADAPEGGHAPDRPYLEVAKAMRMASGALKMLQEAYMLYSGRPAPAIDGAMLEQDLGRAFSYTDSDEHTRAAYWKGLISLRLGDAPHYDPGTSPITSDAWSRAISDHVRAIKDLTEGRMNPYSLLPPDELRQEW